MSLRFCQFLTEGIAQLSYLIGDTKSRTCAIFDPRRDVEIYLETARSLGLAITQIFETHIHADFVSGSRELAARLGDQAEVYVSTERQTRYDFPHKPLKDGFTREMGEMCITARHTPGHTPEHMSFLLSEKDRDAPWAVLSGDCLFADSVGRPDLLGPRTEELAADLFQSLNRFYLTLDDGVIVYPGHGSGSPCGAHIGSRLASTIGYERRFNSFLKARGFEEFRHLILGSLPPVPNYYPHMKKVNQAGPEILGEPAVPGFEPRQFKELVERGEAVLVDTRSMLAFGGGHIPRALNIGARPILSVWAGWLLRPDQPILLVLENDSELPGLVPLFTRTGYSNLTGYLAGGMAAWLEAGYEMRALSQLSVQDIRDVSQAVTVLDVRSNAEWGAGHIPGARNVPLPELMTKAEDLVPKEPVAVYCGGGYRASLAASLLLKKGFTKVRNIPGSFGAWKRNGYPVESELEAADKVTG
ncbi:MAG: MBL fold metallo-hydrolase [Acidobacteria bacterium]|nr:MAG: MBL fold metallo-hydrolase [Acidobacteriota bacterium]